MEGSVVTFARSFFHCWNCRKLPPGWQKHSRTGRSVRNARTHTVTFVAAQNCDAAPVEFSSGGGASTDATTAANTNLMAGES